MLRYKQIPFTKAMKYETKHKQSHYFRYITLQSGRVHSIKGKSPVACIYTNQAMPFQAVSMIWDCDIIYYDVADMYLWDNSTET